MTTLPPASIAEMMGEPDEVDVFFILDADSDPVLVLCVMDQPEGEAMAWVH